MQYSCNEQTDHEIEIKKKKKQIRMANWCRISLGSPVPTDVYVEKDRLLNR